MSAESMFAPYGQLQAACSVTALGALSGNSYGVVSAELAANVFTITLDPNAAIDSTNAGVMLQCRTADGAILTSTQTSDTVFTIRGFDDAGAALDVAFDFLVFRRGMG
mgnify:CR=1 FL=1